MSFWGYREFWTVMSFWPGEWFVHGMSYVCWVRRLGYAIIPVWTRIWLFIFMNKRHIYDFWLFSYLQKKSTNYDNVKDLLCKFINEITTYEENFNVTNSYHTNNNNSKLNRLQESKILEHLNENHNLRKIIVELKEKINTQNNSTKEYVTVKIYIYLNA